MRANPKTNSRIRKAFIKLVTSPKFEYTILVFIMLNTIALALKWYNEPNEVP